MGWVILCYFIYYKSDADITQEQIDKDEKSPSDYTLLVSNLPQNVTEEEVKDWMTERMRNKGKEIEIKKVNLCYSTSKLMKLIYKWRKLAFMIIPPKPKKMPWYY